MSYFNSQGLADSDALLQKATAYAGAPLTGLNEQQWKDLMKLHPGITYGSPLFYHKLKNGHIEVWPTPSGVRPDRQYKLVTP